MANVTEETIRKTLNAYAVETGSKQLSVTAALLAASVSTPLYTGGIILTNASPTIQLWYSTTTTAVVEGPASSPIPPNGSIPIGKGDLHVISVIAESGTPYVGWQATVL